MSKNTNKFNRFLAWLALNLFRAFIIITAYALQLFTHLAEFIIYLLHLVGRPLGVNIKCESYATVEEGDLNQKYYLEQQNDFTPKFTTNQIRTLADRVTPDATIQDIQDELGVSYRQARKIKMTAKNTIPLSINNYTARIN